jgi:hypothetical protein
MLARTHFDEPYWRDELRWVGEVRVHFVNRTPTATAVLTFGTYAVRNVNASRRTRTLLTKCTGKPGPPPSMRS